MSDDVRKKMSESKKKYFKINPINIKESTKEKISQSTKERFKDPKEIQKLRVSNKKFEDSKTQEQKLKDILVQDCKSVIQYDKNMTEIMKYPSIRSAEKITKIFRSNISKCCQHKIKSAGGFIWRFEGDDTPPIPRKKRITKYVENKKIQ